MDKLSEHAIRMLEIVDGENDFFRNDNERQADIARAVYDVILQVQMLKMVDRKTEPQTEETEMERLERIDNDLEDAWARIRELTDEPHHSGEVTEMVEPQTDLLVKAPRKSRESHEKETEPQTESLKAVRELQEHFGIKREPALSEMLKNEPKTDCPWK